MKFGAIHILQSYFDETMEIKAFFRGFGTEKTKLFPKILFLAWAFLLRFVNFSEWNTNLEIVRIHKQSRINIKNSLKKAEKL